MKTCFTLIPSNISWDIVQTQKSEMPEEFQQLPYFSLNIDLKLTPLQTARTTLPLGTHLTIRLSLLFVFSLSEMFPLQKVELTTFVGTSFPSTYTLHADNGFFPQLSIDYMTRHQWGRQQNSVAHSQSLNLLTLFLMYYMPEVEHYADWGRALLELNLSNTQSRPFILLLPRRLYFVL